MFLQRHLSSAKTRCWGRGTESSEWYECKRKVFSKGHLEPLWRREGTGCSSSTDGNDWTSTSDKTRGKSYCSYNSFKSGYDITLSLGFFSLMGSAVGDPIGTHGVENKQRQPTDNVGRQKPLGESPVLCTAKHLHLAGYTGIIRGTYVETHLILKDVFGDYAGCHCMWDSKSMQG